MSSQRPLDQWQAKPQHLLWAILLLAALFRIPFLGTNPNGFHADEAAIGYDAYSILKTGADQFGNFLPVFSRSFGAYDEALFRYLAVPFIYIFGLNEFATRLPTALLGILSVWVLYRLADTYFGQRPGLLCAFFLAINPWHIQMSRFSCRAILLSLLLSLALFFFLKLKENPKYLLLSALCFALGLHTYNAARVFIPLFMLAIVALYWRELWRTKGFTLAAMLLFLAILIPLSSFWISPAGMERAGEVLNLEVPAVLMAYWSYFDPQYLFFSGDPNLRHSIRHMGMLHHFEIVTLIAGILALFKQRDKKLYLLWIWLILYPIPAALTEPSHAIRTIVGPPLFALFSGYGLGVLGDVFKAAQRYKGFVLCTALVVGLSLAVYGKMLFVDYPKYSARWWTYGMKEAIEYAEASPLKTLISDAPYPFLVAPYIYVLFYTQYPPAEYQKLPLKDREMHWRHTTPLLDKYYVSYIPNVDLVSGRFLLIINPNELSAVTAKGHRWKEVHTVRDFYGQEMLKLIEINASGPSQ